MGKGRIVPRSALDVAKTKIIKSSNDIADTYCSALNSYMSSLSEITPSLSPNLQSTGGEVIIKKLEGIIDEVESSIKELYQMANNTSKDTGISYTEIEHTEVIKKEETKR